MQSLTLVKLQNNIIDKEIKRNENIKFSLRF